MGADIGMKMGWGYNVDLQDQGIETDCLYGSLEYEYEMDCNEVYSISLFVKKAGESSGWHIEVDNPQELLKPTEEEVQTFKNKLKDICPSFMALWIGAI